MKTLKQLNFARRVLADRLMEEGLSHDQHTWLMGALHAIAWAADGPDSQTMDRLMSGEPISKPPCPTN